MALTQRCIYIFLADFVLAISRSKKVLEDSEIHGNLLGLLCIIYKGL